MKTYYLAVLTNQAESYIDEGKLFKTLTEAETFADEESKKYKHSKYFVYPFEVSK
ncbi:MAG: hypothetical protein JKY50_22340 [Oleispira sp.]|nr:hypothetical protein [Oleispira sp.]